MSGRRYPSKKPPARPARQGEASTSKSSRSKPIFGVSSYDESSLSSSSGITSSPDAGTNHAGGTGKTGHNLQARIMAGAKTQREHDADYHPGVVDEQGFPTSSAGPSASPPTASLSARGSPHPPAASDAAATSINSSDSSIEERYGPMPPIGATPPDAADLLSPSGAFTASIIFLGAGAVAYEYVHSLQEAVHARSG